MCLLRGNVFNTIRSTGIDAEAFKGETRSDYFDSKLVYWYNINVGSTSTVCHSYYDIVLYISEENLDIRGSGINVPLQKLPRQVRESIGQYLLNSLGLAWLVGNIYIGKLCTMGVYDVFTSSLRSWYLFWSPIITRNNIWVKLEFKHLFFIRILLDACA